jgi:hypothetical protein
MVASQIKLVETWKWVTLFFSTVSRPFHHFRRLPPFPPITTSSTDYHQFHGFPPRDELPEVYFGATRCRAAPIDSLID